MDQLSCIYWFSGTGNSLYAAKKLSEGLGGLPLVQITNQTTSDAVGGAGGKIGFVFPSYYGNLPRAVRAFVERLAIKPDTYIFAVVTMGAVGHGSIGALESVLKAKGLTLSYGRGLNAPANYVMIYNPADPEKSSAAMAKANQKLQQITAEISAGKQAVKKLPFTTNNLYKDIASLDAAFTVGDSCTSCGICEKICPVGNIRLDNGKPVWLHHCEHCAACISWCPVKAIDYGDATKNRRRYRNKLIHVSELTRKE